MAKLYVFGIGGTGSRVLKSLTMLMAAGVKVQDAKGIPCEIVPIVIDPDHAAADLTRTVKLMQDYKKVYDRIDHNSSASNTFFGTKINMDIIPSVRIPLENTLDIDFKEYIGLSLMKDDNGNPNANYALASMLFSQKNLDAKMDVGFKGNPNIGSVVLNQFALSKEFRDFAASFGQNDRIFIISSIFGGTGASGFPLLLKKIRAISQEIAGNNNVKNSVIGAVSVLPYFDVKPSGESDIDSSTFVSKTKAALSYYDRNMREANILYYIGDCVSKQYENSEGGTTQRNEAHFVELAAALALVDFAAQSNLRTIEATPDPTIYKEFGVREATDQIIFGTLDGKTNHKIKKPLTAFTLFCKYLNEQIWSSKSQPWAKDRGFDDNFLNGAFFQTELSDIKTAYLEWLTEMSNNYRAFAPYDLREKKDDVYSMIKGERPARSIKSNYALFNDKLNKNQGKVKRDASKEHIFIELFYLAINEVVKSKFRL
ncbi:MAG: hypothetical protein LBG80_05640 [Bacteroidales bacterium]|jgi:hypothetical protein|nr:hypothetical protein [Bacteroidales bacterium]